MYIDGSWHDEGCLLNYQCHVGVFMILPIVVLEELGGMIEFGGGGMTNSFHNLF